MSNISQLEKTLPTAPLKIIALDSCKELGQKVGEFTLVSDKEAREIAHIKTPIDAVHLIEDGPVRSSVEAIFKFNVSFLIVRYVFDKKRNSFDIFTNVIWCEKDRN